eukprot:13035375-Ditylum_brightwellii.AAC.1
MGELHVKDIEYQEKQCQVDEEKDKHKDDRKIFFVLGHTRCYTNLWEKFCGDLVSKINANVDSLGFMEHPCSCSRPSRVNGHCTYKMHPGYIQSKNDAAFL